MTMISTDAIQIQSPSTNIVGASIFRKMRESHSSRTCERVHTSQVWFLPARKPLRIGTSDCAPRAWWEMARVCLVPLPCRISLVLLVVRYWLALYCVAQRDERQGAQGKGGDCSFCNFRDNPFVVTFLARPLPRFFLPGRQFSSRSRHRCRRRHDFAGLYTGIYRCVLHYQKSQSKEQWPHFNLTESRS
jgi:hypothetical protein